jgi:dienelactone hydrolase
MAEIVLFHHVQGLTQGVAAFADTLRQAGHIVHVPELLDGKRFASIPAGMAYMQKLGFQTILERGAAAVAALPENLVYIGMSMGVLPAQALAQTRPGAQAAVFLHSAVPVEEFGPGWPAGLPVQIHAMDGDAEFVASGDIDAARALVAQADDGELFLYPGKGHLFTDATLPDYDPTAAARVTARVLAFLR